MINSIGLLIVSGVSLTYYYHRNNIAIMALGTMLFINGIVHTLASLVALKYSPGTVTGVVLFIPFGILIFRRLKRDMQIHEKVTVIVIGILFLLCVSLIGVSI